MVDSCGLFATCVQIITVEDTEDPTIVCPADVTADGCTTADIDGATGLPFSSVEQTIDEVTFDGLDSTSDAADNCGVLEVRYIDAITNPSCPLIVERTFTVYDTCGLIASCIQVITIEDTELPTIICPADQIAEGCVVSDLLSITGIPYSPVENSIDELTFDGLDAQSDANDNCGVLEVRYVDVITSPSCPITVERTFTVYDSCSLTATCTQVITIQDIQPPSIVCPSDVTGEGCDEQDVVTITGLAYSSIELTITEATFDGLDAQSDASDNCGVLEVRYIDVITQPSCPLTIERTFTVYDSCGLTASCIQIIEVEDTQDPTIICPADQVIEGCWVSDIAGPTGLPFSTVDQVITEGTFDALDGPSEADDNCGVAEVRYVDVLTNTSCPITVERTFTVVDSCGLFATCVQIITVEDTEDPSITCPADITTAGCGPEDLLLLSSLAFSTNWSPINYSTFIALDGASSASVNCGILEIQYRDIVRQESCPLIVERTFMVLDTCLLTASCIQTITVDDTDLPTISCPDPLSVQCIDDVPNPFSTLQDFEDAGGAASDNCGINALSFQMISEVSDGNSCPEVITRTYKIEDDCGNLSTCIRTIRVNDTIAPDMTGIPEDATAQCDEVPDPPQIGLEIQGTDNCGAVDISFEESIVPGECEAIYQILRIWTAVDQCGNEIEARQTITVVDCKPDVTIDINPNPACLGADVTLTGFVTDNFSDPIYRWQKFFSGTWVDVPGGRDLVHILTNVQMGDATLYRLLIAGRLQDLLNPDCNVISDPLELIIIPPLVTNLEEEICEGDSYQVGSSTYTEAGSYTDILVAASGCDSVVNLDLTVIQPSLAEISVIICEGDTYRIGSSVYNQSGTYMTTIESSKGCDSIVTLNLTVVEPTITQIDADICEGQQYQIAGESFDETGNYIVVLSDQYGCDSILNIELMVWPNYSEAVFADICDGDTYQLAGEQFSSSGIYTISLNTVHGCDSSITLNLNVTEAIYATLDRAICTGDSILVNGKYYSAAGTYLDTTVASGGCDSIITLNLEVVDEFVTNLDIEICEGESFTVGTNTYSESGTYSDMFTSSAGCDSLVLLTLSVHPIKDTVITASICQGELFLVAGNVLTMSGSYDYVLPSSNGCDSLIHVDLVVSEPYDTTHFFSICAGESATVGSETYDSTGIYTQSYTTINGCDSIIIVDVRVTPVYLINLTQTICEGSSIIVGSNTYSESGMYVDSLLTVDGCDSIISLDLQVLTSLEDTLDVQICEGSSYMLGTSSYSESGTYMESFVSQGGCDSNVVLYLSVLTELRDTLEVSICEDENYNFDGDVTSVAGTYEKSYISQFGCDSTVTLILSVNPTYSENINVQICEGEFYEFGGSSFSQPGTYVENFSTQFTCDSSVILNLTVIPTKRRTINQQICFGQSYSFGNQMIADAGTYIDTLPSDNGCDSIVTLNLEIKDILRDTLNVQICSGQTYDFNGTQLDQPGSYEHMLNTSGGCDSIVTLFLSVNDVLLDTIEVEICVGQTFNFNGTELDQPGSYEHSLVTVSGCDSLVTLLLEVSDVLRDTFEVEICTGQSYDFNGTSLDQEGTYEHSLFTSAGCDSIVTLFLSITDILRDTIEAIICEGSSYEFNGTTHSSSGEFEHATVTQSGCDSIVTLILSINPETASTMTEEICEGQSYDFYGTMITMEGTYTHTLSTVTGCDSTVTLNLSLNSSITSTISAQICPGQSYDFNGMTVNEGGVYKDTLISAFGCDSIVTLDLLVNDILRDTIYKDRCEGQPYDFNGMMLDSTGEYGDTVQTNDGCQSIVILYLTVKDVLSDTISASICDGETYQLGSSSFTSTGNYSETFVSSLGCDSVVLLDLIVLPQIATEQTIEICAGEQIEFEGAMYGESTVLTGTYVSSSGCDSVVTVHLNVISQKEMYLSYSICAGDSVLINGIAYNVATIFTEHQVSSGGCDSIVTHEIFMLDGIDPVVTDQQICAGESVELNVNGTGGANLFWSPAASLSCQTCTNPIATPEATTIYTVTVEGCGGEIIERTLTVEVLPIPDLVVSPDVVIQLGEAVTLAATTSNPNHLISWSNENTGVVICTGCPTTIQQPDETTVYRAIASNELGCPVDLPVLVTIEDQCEVGEIEAANAFTPNGDGFNDRFEIRNTGDAEIVLVQVFNRWGEVMFESRDNGTLWDGNYAGESLNPGVYMYQIQAVCVEQNYVILTGNITLIR
ncbi:MAG: gliding motility-associated C-terminal domain-containing protein [Saprospiraceae bacterium]|nr:gliding motility-associated C-terminal domain-containing protein [Saprospiraceae bacterium]